MTYQVILSPRARRVLGEVLPESVAAACWEFIRGPLAENPRRVGKPLDPPMGGMWAARRGEYRVIYTIHESRVVVEILRIAHRRDVYRR